MIYDCFTFFNELDLLEIRLNILDEHVDYFVLGESEETFSGLPKPLYYEENKSRFEKWNHKIIHLVTPKSSQPDSFQRAHFQKENLKTALVNLDDEDIVYFGDTDEIWNPFDPGDEIYNLKQICYCYYLNNRSSENWVGTIVGRYRNIKNNTFSYFRANHFKEIDKGGWHFTNMGGVDQIIKKIESYDHQEFNNDWIKLSLKNRIESGQDYVGRPNDWQGKSFSFSVDESDLPQFILDNRNNYPGFFK